MIKVTCDVCGKDVELEKAYNICVAKFSSELLTSTNLSRRELCPDCWSKVAMALGLATTDANELYYCNGCGYFKADDKYCCLGYVTPRSDCHSKSHNAYQPRKLSREAELAGIEERMQRNIGREYDRQIIQKMKQSAHADTESKTFSVDDNIHEEPISRM